MELTTNGVLITDAIKFVQARPKAIGDRLVSIFIPKLFSSSIHTINNIKEFTNSSPQTESIKKALPEALVRRKILLKNMMRKNNLEGITLALLCIVINYKTTQLGPIS